MLCEHFLDAGFHVLKGLPVTARDEGVLVFTVWAERLVFVIIRIPVAGTDAFEQRGADTVTFDREGVIGVADINCVDLM